LQSQTLEHQPRLVTKGSEPAIPTVPAAACFQCRHLQRQFGEEGPQLRLLDIAAYENGPSGADEVDDIEHVFRRSVPMT
jgi:hypothetical protein